MHCDRIVGVQNMAFVVGGNAGGQSTSLYITARLQDYHHNPSWGPFEAKQYEGSTRNLLDSKLYSSPNSLDALVGHKSAEILPSLTYKRELFSYNPKTSCKEVYQ